MITPLDRPIRRLLELDGVEYVVTLAPDGLRITRKGHRKGQHISWPDLLTGSVELDAKLVKSLRQEKAE